MDIATHDVPVRSARDRLIDLLGIGDTYPLTDLNVVADQLKVPFGGTAKIPIENAQAGVTYQLCDPKGKSLGDQFKAEGSDATLVIKTPNVTENVTYRILATKQLSPGSTLPAQDPRFLDEAAPVTVGLDLELVIEIADYSTPGLPKPVPAPLLDPANGNPQPSDPRIVPFGASVDVRVNNSQEGVEYSLIVDGQDVKNIVRTGNLAAIILPTGPMHEDAVIQVRATKNFLAAENKNPETEPLNATLYLKVLANPTLTVSVDPSPIVDYLQDATIKVASTQGSAKYRAYIHAIPDADFVHGDATGADIVTVLVAGRPNAQVRKPPRSDAWSTPDGYAPLGDGPVPGTDGDLPFLVKTLSDDTIVIVQASKEHRVDLNNPTAGSIPSSIRLEQAAAVLVCPDGDRALTLRVPVIAAQTGDTMQVSGGQPGVFYHFRLSSESVEFPLPAYFHKRDDQDATQNKGVGQLGVEIDFAVATDPDVRPADGTNPAMVFPRPPLVGITPFDAGGSLSIRAVKAQAMVEASKAQLVEIAVVPAIHADQAVVDYGAAATIVIPASAPEDQYRLMLNGAPVKPAVIGNNTDLSMVTDALTADAAFEVVVTRPGDKGIQVERVVPVPVAVAPDATLDVSAKQETVDKGAGTDILIQSSQLKVGYQLMSGQDAIGTAVPGTGAGIALSTGPITSDTIFSITATRADNAQIAVVLKAQASVKINPGASL